MRFEIGVNGNQMGYGHGGIMGSCEKTLTAAHVCGC